MTPSTIPTVSYRRDPSPAPTIFLFEAEPTSPPASSQQTLTTDSSTLYIPFFSYSNWHHSKGDLKMPIAHLAHRPSPCLPAGRSTPPPQQILTADRRPSYMVCLLSAPRTRSEDDPAASEKRLHIQLNRTATLLAKSLEESAALAGEDAFEVEVVDRYPLPPLLVKRTRPLWTLCLRKVLRKWQALGHFYPSH